MGYLSVRFEKQYLNSPLLLVVKSSSSSASVEDEPVMANRVLFWQPNFAEVGL